MGSLKGQVFEHVARVGGAVSSPSRLVLLDLLLQGPRTVESLATEAGQTIANASQHLKVLRAARLVDARKDGSYVTYRIAGEEVERFVLSLRAVAEARIAEIDQLTRAFLAERGQLEPVDRDALVDKVRRGEVTVLDVRPAEEFAEGHLPNAISIPLPELRRRLGELPKRREIVAYCRGPYCVFAIEAVTLLRAKGFRARRLEDGVADWRARGLPVER